MHIPHIITTNSVIAIINGVPSSIDANHPNFEAVSTGLTTSSLTTDQVLDMMKPIRELKRALSESAFYDTESGIQIDINGYSFPLAPELQSEVLRVYRANGDLKPMENFVRNLAANPDKDVHRQLYGFLQACGLTLTEDGCFLAYKRINHNWTDIYTGKIDNSPGQLVEMPRFAVEKNPNITCSHGLHFAAWDYLSSYSSRSDDRTVLLKINPADVVSIPSDYRNMKGRASRYLVLREVERDRELDNLPVYSDDYDDDYDDDFNCDESDELCSTCNEYLDQCECDYDDDEDESESLTSEDISRLLVEAAQAYDALLRQLSNR